MRFAWDNLLSLCIACHAREHGHEANRRFWPKNEGGKGGGGGGVT